MRAFESDSTKAAMARVMSPCCPECAYPGHPSACVRRHYCPCHDVEVEP